MGVWYGRKSERSPNLAETHGADSAGLYRTLPWQHGKQTGSCLSTRNSALKAFPSLSTQEGSCQCLSDQPVCLVQPDATLMNQREVFSRLEHQTDGTHSAKTLCLPVRAGVSLYINLQHKLAPPEQQLQHYQEITCGLFFLASLFQFCFGRVNVAGGGPRRAGLTAFHAAVCSPPTVSSFTLRVTHHQLNP